VTLNWDSVAGATGYRVYRSTDPGAEGNPLKTTVLESAGTGTTFFDTLDSGTAGSAPAV